jgi:hypothetical protein
MIAWESMEPQRLERAIQLLIKSIHLDAIAIDGSGGDAGQDIRWSSPFGLVIFEVKSFSDRLTPSRREQIQRSLIRALENRPSRWVLVWPLNPPPGALAWFEGLKPAATPTEIEWRGRDWLDLTIAGREDIRSFLEGPDYQLLRRAGEFGLEREALATGSDYFRRLEGLQTLVDSMSPYWSWRPTSFEGETAMMLVSKTPDAARLDPIELVPTFEFPPEDPEAQALARQVRAALTTGGDFDVPGEYLSSFRITASSAATQRLIGQPERDVARVAFRSVPEEISHHGRLRIRVGEVDRAVDIRFTRRLRGVAGATLQGADASGSLEVELRLSQDEGAEITLKLADVAGRLATDVVPVMLFLASMATQSTLHMDLDQAALGSFSIDHEWPEYIKPLGRYVLALAIVARHTDRLISIPDDVSMSEQDILDVIRLARALSGHRVRNSLKGFTAALVPKYVPEFLRSIPDEGGALFIRSNMSVNIGGTEIAIPGLATWLPKVRLTNREQLATNAGHEAPTAQFETFDGEGMYIIRDPEVLGEEWQPLGEITAASNLLLDSPA